MVYVDGVLESTVSDVNNSVLNPSVDFWIGGQHGFSSRYFNGDIDDVRIYNRALSESEVVALFNASDPVEPPETASWLSPNPESGTVAPGSNVTVSVRFDAADMAAGDSINTTLTITCNDVLSPTNNVPVSMQVIGSVVSDGSAVAEAWKQLYFGDPAAFSPLLDADGDGLNNQGEYIAGTNPQNSESRFSVKTVETDDGNGFIISWDCVTGRVYSVYWKRGLGEGFQPLETGIHYPQNSYTDTVHHAESCGFYKVEVELDSTSSNP
jgi:hypothetical protein